MIERCPTCGSEDLLYEERDPAPQPMPPPREAYGTWGVCQACGREWLVEIVEHDESGNPTWTLFETPGRSQKDNCGP